MDSIVETTASRIFSDNNDNPAALWTALEESELTKAWIPQTMAGAGLSLADVFGLIRLSGGTTQAVPFTETLFASHLLSSVGLQTPTGPGAVAVTLDITKNDPADREVIEVPFAMEANYIVAITSPDSLSLISKSACKRIDSVGCDPLYQLPLANLSTESTVATLPNNFTAEVFYRTGALVRSAQMCGAMDAILDLTLAHTASREQFGRPLAKFQAIQHLLAEIAGEAAASSAIVDAAVESFEQHTTPDLRNTASAKARTSEAAGIVAANAHQSHGAIGYTQDYTLSTFTRRLWRWREEFGNETQWSIALGNDYLRADTGTLTEEFFV